MSFLYEGVTHPPGGPPFVDVYIDDGRQGEYNYQPVHWNCQDIWNRIDLTMGDGGGVHQEPIVNRTNYAFVKIKNRGYSTAANVGVLGFHCLPGVGLVYPDDWMQMDTPYLSAPDIAGQDNAGVIAGPFEWTPSQVGHECMFFVVFADEDSPNVLGRVSGPIPEWRLVPHDNNIGQRNVAPISVLLPMGLVTYFDNRPFWIRNSFNRKVSVEIIINLPELLSKNDWKLTIISTGGQSFYMKKNEKRKVLLKMIEGKKINLLKIKQHIEVIVKQDGIIVGGMNYYVDNKMEKSQYGKEKGSSKINYQWWFYKNEL
ncbi:MAG: hypothetical protein IPP72_16240 [Chitinophagaceae bacterium]|nr:hypothetical protein [Chitinophagaceae bacterium]